MKTFEFNNFIYYDGLTEEGNLIKVGHKKKRPKSVYKFYSLSENSVKCLTESYFYAPHPYELNDILDGSTFFLNTSKPIPFNYYESFLKNLMEPDKFLEFYEEDIKRNSRGYIALFWQMLSNRLGIISVTTIEDNLLMWPHYTNERGFQIKFNTNALEKSIIEKLPGYYFGFHPINYTKELVQLDLSKINSTYISLLYCATVKSIKWKYENEWRFIVSNENMGVPNSKSGLNPSKDLIGKPKKRLIYYDKNLVEEITFGANFIIGKDFHIERLKNSSIMKVKLINKRKKEQKIILNLLNFCLENLSDKIYFSGHTLKENKNKQICIKRTKERMIVTKIDEITFQFERTHEWK